MAPDNVRRAHQSLHHVVADAPWSGEAVLRWVRKYALAAMTEKEPVAAWVVDDTGLVKKGTHSVGVARQYCGQVGKPENCRVAVSLSVTTKTASLPVAWRLYLPESWAQDPERREQAGVPEEITFETKPAIALKQIRGAVEEGIPTAPVLGDEGYGNDTQFRQGVTELGLLYVLGVTSSTTVWRPEEGPLPKKAWSGRGQRPKRLRRDAKHRTVSVLASAQGVPERAWKSITWWPGTKRQLRSRFAALRVRPAHRDEQRTEPRRDEWLFIEWPKGETEPTKYWLSTLPAETKLRDLVRLAKLRWIIEGDYEELKQESGLGHFEGRGWCGFQHHATLCIAAYGFLVAERSCFPPLPEPVNWVYPCPKSRRISGRGVLPVRSARHHPWSIATLRMMIAQILLRRLKGCPFCGTPFL
jgi:SRSO17 transposase